MLLKIACWGTCYFKKTNFCNDRSWVVGTRLNFEICLNFKAIASELLLTYDQQHSSTGNFCSECTLDTDKSGCTFDVGTQEVVMQYYVNLNSPVWAIGDKEKLVNKEAGAIRFWECSNNYTSDRFDYFITMPATVYEGIEQFSQLLLKWGIQFDVKYMCEFLHCNEFCCRRRRDVIADNFGFDSHGTINQRAVDVLHAKGTVDDRLLILYFKWRSSEIKLILNDAVQPRPDAICNFHRTNFSKSYF